MIACRGPDGTLDLSLRWQRGVVYVNGSGCMDEAAGSALLRVVSPLLSGASCRRVVVDLCDVGGADRFAARAVDQLRAVADAHHRQLAVLVSTPSHDEVEARRRRRAHRDGIQLRAS